MVPFEPLGAAAGAVAEGAIVSVCICVWVFVRLGGEKEVVFRGEGAQARVCLEGLLASDRRDSGGGGG